MKTLIIGSVLFFAAQSHAFQVLCVDRDIQDAQVTALFTVSDAEVSVSVAIPTGETSAETATGTCEAEEDSRELSLRCSDVRTDAGVKYFARIDGRKATVARDGKILATIPCDPATGN